MLVSLNVHLFISQVLTYLETLPSKYKFAREGILDSDPLLPGGVASTG
jgi:hypothetical protein